MTGVTDYLIGATVQCWGCPVFDRLFASISAAAAAVYDKFAYVCVILFCVLFAVYIVSAVWRQINPRDGKMDDTLYQKSVRPVFINSIVALVFLGMGVMLPRFVTTITLEPVAQVALLYSRAVTQTDGARLDQAVEYTVMPMPDDGFFRPKLRNTIIDLMKTTIGQFQNYMKLGIAVMDRAFEWRALLGVGALVRHILMFAIGLYMVYEFLRLFVRFCFKFIDVIVSMAMFAFFFPLSLILAPFEGAAGAPKWFGSLGRNVGRHQIKNIINAIVGLAAAVLTYSVIMAIIAKYFAGMGITSAELTRLILSGDVSAADLTAENIETMTIGGIAVLAFLMNYLWDQIPGVTKMVLGAFNASPSNSMGDKVADDVMKLTTTATAKVTDVVGKIISGDGGAAKK